MDVRDRLLALFNAGVAAVSAEACLSQHLPTDRPRGRTVMIAVGKAAGAMAKVALRQMHIDAGLIVTRYGHMPAGWQAPDFVRVIEAGHPSPDAASLAAGSAALDLAQSLGARDRLIALISGGGSALMAAPAEGVAFTEKQAITRELLKSGAPISQINRVRAALSRVKGGRLAAAAYPAEVLTFIISDIPGDDAALVASGPTIATNDDTLPLEIIRHYRIDISPNLAEVLAAVPTPIAVSSHAVICARSADALAAIAHEASAMGYSPVMLGDALEGDAIVLAKEHAAIALAARARGERVALISGGETTVRIGDQAGAGGRNTTYALALAIALNGEAAISAIAADSDGIDGNCDAAGALLFPASLAKMKALNIDPHQSLFDNNSYAVFDALNDGLKSGPTYTNVNDLRVILVD